MFGFGRRKKANDGQKSDGDGSGGVTLVLKVDTGCNCIGCAKKVEKTLKKVTGVKIVKTDLVNNKVTVVGNVDPAVVKSTVEARMNRTVELVSVSPQAQDQPKPRPSPEPQPKEREVTIASPPAPAPAPAPAPVEGIVYEPRHVYPSYQGYDHGYNASGYGLEPQPSYGYGFNATDQGYGYSYNATEYGRRTPPPPPAQECSIM